MAQVTDLLEKTLNLPTKNIEVFTEALTHRSYINEVKDPNLKHNERLEFLGDAVLELAVTKFLFNNYPDQNEGTLTSFRAALVKTESLALEAKKLDLGEFLLMSKGEEATGGRQRPYILANTMEAIIGAMYITFGFEVAEKFILEKICYKIETIAAERSDLDAKSRLQELAQERVKVTPAYKLISATGPDHNKSFEMGVYIGENLFGKGEGKSKQEAEQVAALEAMKNWEELEVKYYKN